MVLCRVFQINQEREVCFPVVPYITWIHSFFLLLSCLNTLQRTMRSYNLCNTSCQVSIKFLLISRKLLCSHEPVIMVSILVAWKVFISPIEDDIILRTPERRLLCSRFKLAGKNNSNAIGTCGGGASQRVLEAGHGLMMARSDLDARASTRGRWVRGDTISMEVGQRAGRARWGL